MAYYTIPPGFVPYHPDYPTSTSTSPSPDDGNDYYPPPQFRTPQGSPYTRSKSRNHVRTTSYTMPRTSTWTPPMYSHPGYAAPFTSPPVPRHDYVSSKDSHKQRARRNTTSGRGNEGIGYTYADDNAKRRSTVRTSTQPIYVDVVDEGYDSPYDSPRPVYKSAEPRYVKRSSSTKKTPTKADSYFFFNQTTSYEADTPVRSRVRRSSTNTRPTTSPAKPTKVKSPKATTTKDRSPRVATAADAARCKIPAGFSLKNWDPDEKHILLLGSVFDANSLGKWIYDWTVYHHRAGSPMTEVAGELWLLLIKFAGKLKRADKCLRSVRGSDNREVVRDFIAAGDRIWHKLMDLIKSCEDYMWTAAKKSGKGKLVMGEKSGIEFVESVFGRERELERTEKLMTHIRLFNMRFDANCEDILRRT